METPFLLFPVALKNGSYPQGNFSPICSSAIRAISQSKSTPLRNVSSCVETTLKDFFPPSVVVSMTVTSSVPPLKSLTRTCLFGDDASDSPAIAAAVGSLTTRITSKPASVPARIVSARWKCVKYAGMLMTALTFAAVS